MKVKVFIAQSCLTLCDPVDCGPQGSSVHGILQARILEWVAISYSRDLPEPGIKPASLKPPTLADGFCTTVPLLLPHNFYETAKEVNTDFFCFKVAKLGKVGEGWEEGWQKQDFNLHILIRLILSTRNATRNSFYLRSPRAIGRNYEENFGNDKLPGMVTLLPPSKKRDRRGQV